MKKRALTNCDLAFVAHGLLANENQNARRQRDKIKKQDGRAEINAKTHETINDQVYRD